MSVEPLRKTWDFDEDRFIPVARLNPQSSPSKTKCKTPSAVPGLVVLGIGAIASLMALAHYGNMLAGDWNTQRETSAQQELAAIKKCLGGK